MFEPEKWELNLENRRNKSNQSDCYEHSAEVKYADLIIRIQFTSTFFFACKTKMEIYIRVSATEFNNKNSEFITNVTNPLK